MIRFNIPGHPVGKGRARSTLRGFKTTETGKRVPVIGHYTPAKTRTWEGVAATMAMQAMAGARPLEGPVGLVIEIRHAIPSSWPRWKVDLATLGLIRPTVKPDADNVEKALKDAMNGIVWRDDCQVVECTKTKRYGREPGVHVTVNPLPQLPAQITRQPTHTPTEPVEA